MEEERVSDRRTGHDRRVGGAVAYSGPEKRTLKYRRVGLDRRGLLHTVCLYCGQSCDDQRSWSHNSVTIETTADFRMGICSDCSSKKFPQFYTDN